MKFEARSGGLPLPGVRRPFSRFSRMRDMKLVNNKLKFAILNSLINNRPIINVDFIFLISGVWRDQRNV